ncbi:MAG: T9SS type A sorting domain-containing protein [Bacteroidales bacterium]|nr:T9SS type A sorting domain-containing protein [Bacteroidales bacterium]
MKKFMIFLLMAFLYLGTSQARSEAPHFKDAKAPLPSWVKPTSHSFFADSKAVNAGVATISPSAPQELGLGTTVSKRFAVSYAPEGTEAADSYLWYVNGAPTDSTGTTFTVTGYPVGTYSISCRVHTTAGNYVTSNVVMLTVANDVVGSIVGPDYACQNDVVTLTAQASTTEVAVQYQWRRNGQPIVGATNPTYTFDVSALPSLPDTLAYEFDCQLVYAGCEGRYTPVHYFYVYPTPVTTVTAPMFCSGAASVTLTATANTAGSIQPYKWEWYKDGALLATTYTNTYDVTNPVNGDKYVALPIYLDFACNDLAGDTVTLQEYTATLSDITLALVSPATSPFCAGFTSFKVTDPNKAMNPIYAWYLDGVLIAGASDSIYAANMEGVGEHTMKVVASYPDSACGTKEFTLNFQIDTVPTIVSLTGNSVICGSGTTPFSATATPATAGLYWDGEATPKTTFDATPGMHTVIAKSANGCMSEPMTFTVSSLGTDLHITASATAVCEGQHITLSADLSDHIDSNVVYTWSTGSHNSTIDVMPTASNKKYSVTASYGSCSNVDSIEISINPLPAAPQVSTDKTGSICPNDQIVFTTSSTAAGSFIWYVDGVEVPGNNLDTLVLTDQISGAHYVNAKVVDTNGCISPVSLAANYTVDTLPSLLAIAGNHVICYGDSAMLIAQALNAVSYRWSNGADKDTIYAYPGVYTVTASSANGCSIVSDPFTVTEFGPDVHITASATSVCPGSPVTLTADADQWIDNVTYSWDGGPVGSTITVTPTEDTTWYKVTATVTSNSGYGEEVRTCQRTDSIMIALYPVSDIESVTIVSSTTGDTICFGSQLTLKATPDTLAAYRWFQDGIEIPGHNLDTITIVPEVGVHTYAVQAINQFGCETGQHALSTPILVLPNPSLVITGDPLICNDSLIRLFANINDTTNSTAGNALYDYEWRVYNYTIDTNAAQQTITDPYTNETFVINPLAANSAVFESYFPHQDHPYIFTVNAKNANGCVVSSDPYYVYVADTIFVAVTLDYDSVCPGGEVTAIAHLGNYHTPDLTFQWYKNDTLVPYATEPWFTSSVDVDPTIFRVEVSQSTTGCFATGADTAHFLIPKVVSAVVAINGTNSSDPLEVCEGAQIVVTAYLDDAMTIVDSTLTYVWKENGFWMPLVTGPSFAKQMWIHDHDSANYVYEVYAVVDVPGCLPVPVASNKVHVRRNPIVIIEGVHNVCYHVGNTDPNVILSAFTDGQIDLDATYNWYRNGSLVTSSGAILNLLYETVEPTHLDPVVYMVEVNNGDGCTAFSEPFPVEVYEAPVVNILASDTLICEGGVVDLQARINNYNDPMLTYQWFENTLATEGLLAGRTHANETFTVNNTTDFIVKVTHLLNDLTLGDGCVDFDTVTVTVNPDPVLTITNDLPASKTLCDGRSVTFTATVTPGVDTVGIYTWYRNGEIIPNAVGAQFTETPHALNDYPTTYIYEVSILQPTTGCESIVTLADTVTVNPNPTLAIEADPIVCRADSDNVLMIAHVYPEPTTPYTFTWFEDNAALDTTFTTGEHQDTITLTREYRDYPYNFSISLVNEYGCQATAETQIYVDTLPVINITATETEICVGGEITLTANLNNWNTPNMEFHWYDNDSLIAGATSITYTVVPDSGTHNYTFSAKQLNSMCYAISNVVTVNVHADPTLTIDNDLPASKTLCDGRSVTFHAHVAGGVTGGEVYTWYRNGEVIPNAVDSIFTETPHAISDYPTIYVYEVSVKQTAAGCESTVYFADSVTVTPNPTLAIETDPIVCGDANDNIVMIANIDPAPTTPYTFTWYEDNAALDSTLATGEHKDTITLTRPYRDYPYNFSVVLVNEYGCQATAETTIYVDSVPVINITATETEICVGGEITLTANLNNWNTPNMEFHWYDNDTLIPGATSLTYTVVPALGSHNYTFSAKQLNSLCYATSNVVTVNVHADPTLTIDNDLPASKTLCDGRSVTFHAHVAGGVTGGEVYTWYRNGEVIPNAVDSIFTETPHAISDYPTIYVYQVSVKQTAAGCESTVYFADSVTVNPNPTLAIETDPIVCRADANNITMVAHVYPEPTTPYTFTWFEDNAEITGATGAHLDTIVLTREYRDYPYNFSVILVNEYGCQASAETHIYVDSVPVINIQVTENEICVGGEITLTANLDNWNTPNMEFHWYDNDTLIPGATAITYTVVPELGSHVYTFSAKQLNSLCYATSNALTVNVHADPTLTIDNDLPASKTLCDGRSVTFHAHVAGGVTGGEVYTWYRNGEVIPDAVDSIFTETPHAISDYPTIYVYEVSVKQTAAGCESTVYFADSVTVNPNPTLAIESDPIVCRADADNIMMVAHVYPEPTTPYTFTWFEDNAEITGATGAHLDTIVLTREYRDYPYNFSISLVNEYGCQATAETQVYVDSVPVININVTENLICIGGEITLTANLNNWNTPNMEFHWYDNDTLIAGATSLTYTTTPALGVHNYTFSAKQLNSLCYATSNVQIVNVIPDPVIANVTLSDTIVCQGAQIAITANPENYTPSTDDVYTWYRNGILMPGATAQTIYDSPVTVDNNTQQFIYTAVVTRTPSGCTSLPVASAALTIYPNPTVVITGDQHICETDSVFLIANVDTIGTNVGTLHYTWFESGMIRDNMAYSLGDNQFYNEYWYPRTEPYRFTVQVQREGVPAACASTSEEFLVYVYPRPIVNITATETEICEGGEVTLTANLVDPNQENMIYQWYEIRNRVDSFATGYDAAGNLVYTTYPVAYRYDIPGANSNTYTAIYDHTITMGVNVIQTHSMCNEFDEIVITVNPIPVVTDVTVNNQHIDTVCDGAQVDLACTITPADAQGAVYTWYRNGIEIPGANQSTFSENVYTTDNHVTINVYTVKVELPASGCISEISVPNATVIINPAPTTVTISGNNVICENDSTILTVYSDVEGTITWSTGEHTPSITVPAGVYTVTVTTPEGCEKTSDPFTVEALGTDLLVSASETSICAGEHTTLYVNQDGWAGNVTYQWDANAGNSTATTVDVAPEVTTTYTVTATVNSSNNLAGCTAVGNVTIVVTPLPVQLVVTGDTTICQTQQATLTASTTDTNITGYIWYQNGVEIPGENQAVITINFPDYGTYTFAAKAINDQGCVSAQASLPATVTVTPAPTVVSITGNNVICENDSTVLTVYSDVTGTITWSTGEHTPSITVPAGVYTVTVTTPQGCEMTSDPFTVQALGTDLLVSASETHICAGEHTTLYVNQDGWAGNVTYQWDANAENSTANTVDVAPATTTTYHVTATVHSTNNLAGCVATGEVTIVVTPLPVKLTVNASADSVCEGDQVTFTATPYDSTYTYIWYQNGLEIIGEHMNVITVNFPTEGTYTFAAKAINDQGCVSAEASDPVAVVVNAAPDAVVISGNLEICNGGTTTLYANVTPNVAGATYQWYLNNSPITGANGYFLTVAVAGSYKVDVTTNGCTTTSDAVNVNVNEAPQLQLTATESTICQYGTTVISAEATGWNVADVNYNWSNGYQGSSFTFTPAFAGDYTFYVTASQSTSGCTAVDSITIHVNAGPGAPVMSVNANHSIVCEGAQVTLTMTDTNSINYGTPTITWFDNGVMMAGNHTSVTITPTVGIHSYNVVVEYPNSGCNTAISEPIVVTVNAIPTVVVELTNGNNNILCDGGTTTLTANVNPAINPAGYPYTYQWFLNNVAIANSDTNALTVTLNARESSYDYQVLVSGAPGCEVLSDVTPIVVVADPVVVASVDNNVICEGGHATLSVSVDGGIDNVNGLNGYSFAWYSNTNNTTPIATTPTFTVNNATAGLYAYRVVVTSPYGCETTSNVVNLSVVEDPSVTVAVAAGYDATICENGSTMLVANVTGGYGTPSYQWYSNGLPMLGETNRTLVLNNVMNNNFVYTVKVTQTGVDCEAVSTNTVNPFTVVAPYSITVTGNQNTCVGGTVTLTSSVTGVLPGDVPTYQWYRVSENGVAAPIANANNPVYTTEPLLTAGQYEYFVQVTSSISGCSNNSDSYTANVIADPTVVINGAHAVCEQGQLQLNATVTGGIPGVQYTYTWTWTGASTGSATTAVPYYTPNLPANDGANHYYFRVTINPVGTSGCDATSAAHELDVFAVPTVVVTADRGYICQGGDVTFTANVTPAGNYNYAWIINGDADFSNQPSVTTTVNTAGPVTATVTVGANNNLVSCSTTATISVPVQVVADPVVTIAANHTTMCAGGTTTLSINNITANNNIPTNYSYQWAENGHEIPGAVNNTFNQTLNAAGTYVYTLRLTQNDALGCVSEWSAPVTVQVAEQPSVTLYNLDGLNICEGGTIDLNAVVDNYGNTVGGVLNSSIYGPMTYNWTSAGNTVQLHPNVNAGTDQYTQTLNTVGNFDYSVIVTPSGYACQPTASGVVTVSVANDPTWNDVHVYYPDVCVGDQVNLIANIVGGVADYTGNTNGYIQWTVTYNGVTSNVSGGQGGTTYDIPTVAGNYIYTPTYVGNMGSGCQLTNTAAVQQPVLVHEIPTAAFVTGDGSTICANDPDASVELTIAFTGGAPYTFDIENMMTGEILPYHVSLTDTFRFYVSPDVTTRYRIIMLANAYCQNNQISMASTSEVTVNVVSVEFVETTFMPVNCGDDVVIGFNIISGNQNANYVIYENGTAIASGTVVANQVIIPDGLLSEGTHHLTLVIDGCSFDITVVIPVNSETSGIFGNNLMEIRWDDVVIINLNANPRYNIVGFQWYKNNVLIPGAIYKNYQEIGGLNGYYSVELTVIDTQTGETLTFITFPRLFNTVSGMKVYPVPANVEQVVTIELDMTAEELNGAVLDIFDATGKLINHITDLKPVTRVAGFKAQGTYFGRIITGTNEIKTVKFVIVK